MAGNKETNGATGLTSRPSLGLRIVLSAILLWHFAAVFFPPFTFATRSGPGIPSPFAEPIMSVLRPYVDALFLDHGYFFFAPNPGPSHLLRAKLEFADGRPPLELTFPDRQLQKPRLLYHRHFMLAEQLHADFAVPEPPPEAANNPEQLAGWRQARDRYELRRRSFEEHLCAAYGANQVTLMRLEHTLPGPSEFRELGKPLNAVDTYRELPDAPIPLAPPDGGGP